MDNMGESKIKSLNAIEVGSRHHLRCTLKVPLPVVSIICGYEKKMGEIKE